MIKRLPVWIALLILGIAVFGQTRNFDFVVYDDLPFITANPYVNEGFSKENIAWAFTYKDYGKPLMHEGLKNVWHPLPWLSYMADASNEKNGLWHAASEAGLTTEKGGFHLTHLLFHLLSTILVFELTIALFPKPWVAFFTAAFFCLHPLHVETATWIAERKGVMSGTFFFASLLTYLHWCRSKKRAWYSAALALFTLSLMSKPSALILPLILMLLDLYPLNRGPAPEKKLLAFILFHLKEKWPFYALTMATFAAGLFFQHSGTHKDFMTSFPLWLRLETMSASFLFYMKRMLWPTDLTVTYSYPIAIPFIRYFYLLATAIVIGGTFATWKYRKKLPSLLFAWGWFLICILPASGLAYVGTSYTADRYSYLALNGIFIALGLAGARIALSKPSFRLPLIILGIIAVIACAGLSYKQTQIWRNSETLFTHAIKAQPRSIMGYANMGGLWQQRGDKNRQASDEKSALTAYKKALEFYQQGESIAAKDHTNLYNIALNSDRTGDKEKAIKYYEKALASHEKYPDAHFNLGLLYADQSLIEYQPEKAYTHIKRSCELTNFRNPRYAIIHIEQLIATRQIKPATELWKRITQFPIAEPEVAQRIDTVGRTLNLKK